MTKYRVYFHTLDALEAPTRFVDFCNLQDAAEAISCVLKGVRIETVDEQEEVVVNSRSPKDDLVHA
jgi:hypothetical protein